MNTSFRWSFDCSDTSRTLLLKENDSIKMNHPLKNVPDLSKMVYSLKEKKLVKKQLITKKSLKSLKRCNTLKIGQKQNMEETLLSKNKIKTLQIIHEVSLSFQPDKRSIKIQTEPSLINRSRIRMSSDESICPEEQAISTKEMQPRGAQSVVWMRGMGLKKQISNQSTECKCLTGGKESMMEGRRDHPESRTLVRQGRSVTSFFELIENSIKPTYTSVVVPLGFRFSKIDKQTSNNSQSLKNVNTYSHRNSYPITSSHLEQKVTQNSSTFAMNNSTVQSFKSRIQTKKKFDQMDVRSTESIKEEESVDEFSQVLSKSHCSSSSKKISLSGLIMPNKLYDQK